MSPSLIAAIVVGSWLAIDPARAALLGPTGPEAASLWFVGALVALGTLSQGASFWIANQARRLSPFDRRVRRLYVRSTRVAVALVLGVYAWLLLGVGWIGAARTVIGPGAPTFLEELVVLAPFLALQAVVWWGFLRAERMLELPGADRGGWHLLVLEARRQWGLVLPVLLVLLLMQDLMGWLRPEWSSDVFVQTVFMGTMGLLVLLMAPLLVRLAWPTRPLPPCALRTRLESVAQRHGFRYRDVLVWDTGGTMLNAVVTGVVPWGRFVLLTDALLDWLDDARIEAIFGHEMGHIAHRHLSFLGFFFMASLGVAALGTELLPASWPPALPGGVLGDALGSALVLLVIGTYFLVVFGFLSRQFELQADIHGCKVASGSLAEAPRAEGVATFVSALLETADFNGINPAHRSWRHGSIDERVAFLRRLADDPTAERRFQRDLGRWRLGVVLALLVGLSAICVALGRA